MHNDLFSTFEKCKASSKEWAKCPPFVFFRKYNGTQVGIPTRKIKRRKIK